jgi:hypothetical protein
MSVKNIEEYHDKELGNIKLVKINYDDYGII